MWRAAFAFAMLAAPAAAEITSAQYSAPTDRYNHGVLGDAIEYGALEMVTDAGRTLRVTLPMDHVFEDIAPRLADVDRDGDMEVIVVETDVAKGAALAIYDEDGKVAETPHIGSRHRWLAPLGAAQLYGDGDMILAYVDRPHLAKTLRFWRFKDGKLFKVDSLGGVTNHRIGDDFITGGIRDCGNGPEVVLVSGDWRRLVAVVATDGGLVTRDLGSYGGRSSVAAALSCR